MNPHHSVKIRLKPGRNGREMMQMSPNRLPPFQACLQQRGVVECTLMSAVSSIVATVTAGQSADEQDLLAEYSQGRPKALIPIAGKPMVAHVIEALAGSRYVRHILLVALDPATVGVRFPVEVGYVPDAGG